jgi:hypothetical protein
MKKPMPFNAARLLACLTCLLALGGCTVLDTMSSPHGTKPAGSARNLDTGPIGSALEMMAALPQGDPARQAELFQAAKDAAELTPTTSNKLRYALALATPGHSGTDPVAARRQLSELLARPETLLPVERWLALIELKEVEQQLILQAESKRLHDDAAHDARDDKLAAMSRRLATETDENARLRRALDEARAKIDAVTHLEQTITDRRVTGPTNP